MVIPLTVVAKLANPAKAAGVALPLHEAFGAHNCAEW
jgi:hypothetical protein